MNGISFETPRAPWTAARGVDGLVVLAVLLVGRPSRGDVGRQRRVADRREGLVQVGAMKPEAEPHAAVRQLLLDVRLQRAEQANPPLVPEADAVADREPPARLRQSPPRRLIDPLDQSDGDRRGQSVAQAPPRKLPRNDLGIVEHEHVARPQQLRQLPHRAILDRPGRPHDHKARRIARLRRPKRDPLLRQLEIEFLDAHETP